MSSSPSSPPRVLQALLSSEAASGILLMLVAVLALIVANSPLSDSYFSFWHIQLLGLSLLHWVNDGLMAIFFLLVGLEIKREVLEGELSARPKRVLPAFAALGGMLVPALIYVAFNLPHTENLAGWAIPSATDIAFALGILSLLGKRVPVSLKVFLTALAILDDLGAVLIIAVFYTQNIVLEMLGFAALVCAFLYALNRWGVRQLSPYLLAGALLWFLVLKSGIHATLAGVVLAMLIPLRVANPNEASPLHRLEHSLHKTVGFIVLPIFGFANAGISFTGLSFATLAQPVPLGIMAGLFIGKQLGVFASAALAIKMKWAEMPAGTNWLQLYGLSVLCGIGFTMSLFIGFLAFPNSPELVDDVKLGVFAGSVLSGLLGFAILRWAAPRPA